MRHFLSVLDYPDKDTTIAKAPDEKIVGRASHIVDRADHILASSLHPKTRRTLKPITQASRVFVVKYRASQQDSGRET